MREKFIRNISSNALQQIINQLFGLMIFYVLSRGLNKASFGQLNWALGFLLISFQILSFGFDQLTVRKVSAGTPIASTFLSYIFHVLLTGILFYILILIGWLIVGNRFPGWYLLLFIGIGKLMIFFSTPFKQLAAGLEKFHLMAWMSVCSNVVRGTALLIAALYSTINITWVIAIFIAGDVCELLFCLLIYYRFIKPAFTIQWQIRHYLEQLKEALPLIGVAVFTSVMARFDWLFIGVFVSDSKLAEYSFAYKAFEISTLPLLVIGPLLIPAFTKYFQQGDATTRRYFINLLKAELLIACTISLIINCCWSPVIDHITDGKYGAVNRIVVLLLSLTSPLLYINNFLWTILFAQGKLRKTFVIIGITCCINVVADIILIPWFKNEGAAAACLLAATIQFVLYRRATGNLRAVLPY